MKKAISLLVLTLSLFFSIFSQNLISTQAISIEDVKDIYIDLTYEEIEFSPIYGNEIVVDLYANNNHLLPQIIVNKEGRGELIIKTSTKGYNATKGDICKIAVYIPRETPFNNIEISLLHSSFSLDSLKAKDLLIIDRGDEKGRIDILNSSFSSLNLLSNNSFINLQNVKAEYIRTQTKTSDIAFKNISSDYFDVTTKEGFVTVSLSSYPYATSTISTDSSNIEVFVPSIKRTPDMGFTLDVHSNKGTFNNKIDKKKLTPRLGFTKDYNEGGAYLSLNTTSGDITVAEY